MIKKILILFVLVLAIVAYSKYSNSSIHQTAQELTDQINIEDEVVSKLHPLSIEVLRKGKYPGSEITIEETLSPGSNYNRYLASYKSEGLKIYALLTIPMGDKPKSGFPVIIFNHGYIPPAEYQTTERYIAYTDAFSRNGYILFRPDYRGHGNSEGQPTGAYGSSAYVIDVLNAVSSIKKYKDADPNRIGMWGHSMGGHITLRNMVVSKDVKAGVIWAGVVASYPDLINNWRRRPSITPFPTIRPSWRQGLIELFGEPSEDSLLWKSISANSYLSDISGPLQLHHGTADTSVPVEFSQKLSDQMKKAHSKDSGQAGKEVELYVYEGDDHNLANNLGVALDRSVEFFNKYLKGE